MWVMMERGRADVLRQAIAGLIEKTRESYGSPVLICALSCVIVPIFRITARWMVESKHLALALTAIPAAAFVSGYLFNIGFLGSFSASLFSVLTVQDHLVASLRWTSLLASMVGVPLYLALKEAYPYLSRVFKGEVLVSEWTRKAFMAPLTVASFFFVIGPFLWLAGLDQATRTEGMVRIAAAFLCNGAGGVAFGLAGVLGTYRTALTRSMFSAGIVFLCLGVLLLWGGLNAQRIANCQVPTHIIELDGEKPQAIVTLQFVDRGLIGFRPHDKATVVIPWTKIKRVELMNQSCLNSREKKL